MNRPVYEFRPLPEVFNAARRFANGQWIPDDGEYDIAFIGFSPAPVCLYVHHSYQKNIVASWLTTHWTVFQPNHPRGNPWHYALREGETAWGGDWGSRQHENHKAGDAGMNKLAAEAGCANGWHVELDKAHDKHIAAGLVRDRETKEIFTFPKRLVCMYCGVAHGEPMTAESTI
jgi:hypothetical protein